jgi:hypothetical protein
MKRGFIIGASSLLLGAIILFCILVTDPIEGGARKPTEISPVNQAREPSLPPSTKSNFSDEPPASSVHASSQESSMSVSEVENPVANEPLTTPIFYRISTERYASLEPATAAALGMAMSQYSSFYDQWMRIYPHDASAWNDKISEIESDLHMRLGGEGYDNLMRPPGSVEKTP